MNCNLRPHLSISISCMFKSFYTFSSWVRHDFSQGQVEQRWRPLDDPDCACVGGGTDQNHDHKNWLVLFLEWDTKALYWFQISCEGIKIYFMPLKSEFFHLSCQKTIQAGRFFWEFYTLLFHQIKLEGRVSLGAVLPLAWQCLAPSHWHVLFNNVGIFYCFAFITAQEAKTENRNRKPDALKAELYRPTTVRCNMSIWIQKGGFLAGCLLNSAVFSPFPPTLRILLLIFLSILKAASLSLTTHWPSRLRAPQI